jgi:hypothetical protein
MVWTHDKILQIPEEYCDFMLTLKPVIDSKLPGTILRITGIPFGRIVGLLTSKYDYTADDIRIMADTLLRRGLVTEDTLGFFQPTGEGEAFIHAIIQDERNDANSRVPSFPVFKE